MSDIFAKRDSGISARNRASWNLESAFRNNVLPLLLSHGRVRLRNKMSCMNQLVFPISTPASLSLHLLCQTPAMNQTDIGICYLTVGAFLWARGVQEFNRSRNPSMMVFGARVMTEATTIISQADHHEPNGRYGPRGVYDIEKSSAYINLMLRQPNERWFRDALR